MRGHPAWCDTFAVRYVVGDEALVAIDGRRLDMRFAVGVDEEHALVRVIAAIRLKGTAARARKIIVRLAMPWLLRSMVERSQRGMSGVTQR